MEFIILTGMSGAGKSRAADSLEDMGYLCIDNMPVAFIVKFAEMYNQTPNKNAKVAFVVDVRGEVEFDTLISELDLLKSRGYKCKTVFIDCDNKVLVNRYKETRRIHPLVPVKNISMNEAIELERNMLAPIRDYADYVIDTSSLTIRQLHEKVIALMSGNGNKLMVTVMSFGFKYGIANEADLVFDVRCFPNPFYIEEMRQKTGLEEDVKNYVFSSKDTHIFMDKLNDMLSFMIPKYIEEGKTQLTIAIGCTGGKHRSVCMAEQLAVSLSDLYKTVVVHRDIGK